MDSYGWKIKTWNYNASNIEEKRKEMAGLVGLAVDPDSIFQSILHHLPNESLNKPRSVSLSCHFTGYC